jgi:hypothetical protein
MRNAVEIENIEEMRRREGIEDVELREEIRQLEIGDFVKLTLLSGVNASETVLVRITSINGAAFRGKLASGLVSRGLSNLPVGAPVAFTTAHIHSLPKGRPPADP